MIQLGMCQRLVQIPQLELGLGLFEPISLSGAPEDLETFLTDCPQEDEQGMINYLLSGGWAIEMLTGEQRSHHDLDVIRLSKVPLVWRVDEQKPGNYFETISMRPQKLLDDHTQKVVWDMAEFYSEISDSQFEVYVPSNEYLFISKIAGFLREPRPKDYTDLESLAQVIELRESATKFSDILNHIPGMHSKFPKNDRLFTDLSEYFKHMNGNAKEKAGAYLTEIIKNFRGGNSEFAKKQASKFHETLKKIYENGLQECISMKSEGIDYDKFEDAWTGNKLSGFWVKDNGDVDLRIPKTSANLKQLDHLRFWKKVEDQNEIKLSSLERAVDYSRVFIGKKKGEEKYVLVDSNNFKEVSSYNSLNFIPVSSTRNIEGRPKGLIEGVRYKLEEVIENLDEEEKSIKSLREKYIRDIYSRNGKLLFSFETYSEAESESVGILYEELMNYLDYENMQKLEWHAVKNEGMKKGDFEKDREMNYQNLLGRRNYDVAKEFGKLVDVWNKRSVHRSHYHHLVINKEYEQAREFEDNFEDVDSSYIKEEHLRKLLGQVFYSEDWMSGIREENLKNALRAQKYLNAEFSKEYLGEFHFNLIRKERYPFADLFAKRFGLSEEDEMKNREIGFRRWFNEKPDRFTLEKIIKITRHYKQTLDSEFVEQAIQNAPECGDAYLLVPEGELSPERAITAYGLLLKERRLGPAEKIRQTYNLDNSTDYKLFCEDPFIFADRRALDSLDISIDENSQAAALKFTESLMFDKGHKRKEKAKKVIEKFNLPYEKVFEVACKNFDEHIKERRFDRLRKQYFDLVWNERILNTDDTDAYLKRKFYELVDERDYTSARHIGEKILDDAEVYDVLDNLS